jgi:integrase
MARTLRAPKLETRSARLKLAIAKRPYWTQVARGVSLGYRRNQGPGTFSVRVAHSAGHWSKVIGAADDYAESNAGDVLTYWEAANKARTLGTNARNGGGGGPLGTVGEALVAYEADLRRRGGDVNNAHRVRRYLPAALAAKPVATLASHDFKPWSAALAEADLTPAAVNRTNTGFRACLNLAAAQDERVVNSRVWQRALASLPDAGETRNVVLDDAEIRALVAGAYELVGDEFGMLVELAAVTGARVSQLARIEVRDLQANHANPRRLVPASRKGRRRKRVERRPVPIPPGLATRLSISARGRADDTLLLLKADGGSWRSGDHVRPFTRVVTSIGLDAAGVTLYALRHSSITRQLLAGVPIRLVAALHDTSTAMVEKTYSHHIADHSDVIARRAMLDTSQLDDSNITRLVRP